MLDEVTYPLNGLVVGYGGGPADRGPSRRPYMWASLGAPPPEEALCALADTLIRDGPSQTRLSRRGHGPEGDRFVSTRFCPALLLAAPASGQGKTTVTAALARHHRDLGRRVRIFKTGPDFLDLMILERASGAPVYQLDLWMGGEAHCRSICTRRRARPISS